MNELSINLDTSLHSPLYEQIYEYIKVEIQQGNLLSKERLPSTRALSTHLQVSRSTVDLAYEQLVAEGYIETIPCKGYYVCEVEELFKMEKPVYKRAEEVNEGEKQSYEYDFSPNGIDLSNFPYHVWRKINKIILLDAGPELFRLGSPSGELWVRQIIANYLYHARGVRCQPQQLVIGAGNDYLLLLLSQIFGSNHVIAMENPTYKKAYHIFENIGFSMCTINMDEQGMDVLELEESDADVAYVMPSHQYPLGIIMPLKRRMELLKWASANDNRYIIEDDYDSEFRYKGKPIPALQGFDTQEKVIYIGTFSKSVAPSMRISYMVLPPGLLEIYKKKEDLFSATVSKTDQWVIGEFIQGGFFERHLNRMRGIYKGKHDILLREIKKIESVEEVLGENAGVHILVRFAKSCKEQEMIERAASQKIKVYGLTEYYTKIGKNIPQPTIIMGYANLTEEEITQAVCRLQKVW